MYPPPWVVYGTAARSIRTVLRHLGLERAHVVGHSSGGIMALRLALDAPEVVHSLVLLGSERVSIWPRWGELQERLCE